MNMTEIERRSLEKLKLKDVCEKGKADKAGSRLCRDNVSCRDDDCKKCLGGENENTS